MAPTQQKSSQLKRGRHSTGEGNDAEQKKPRRSERLSQVQPSTPIVNKNHLPSPVTHQDSLDSKRDEKEVTATPPNGRPTAISHRRTPDRSPEKNVIVSSPPAETQTQVASQYDHKPYGYLQYVEDEIKEGVWGYLIPLDGEYKQPLILKTRNPCPKPCGLSSKTDKALSSKKKKPLKEAEESFEREKEDDAPGGGYFVGRHPECDLIIDDPIVSNRHCLIFKSNKNDRPVAILEDWSANGTFINESLVGRNQRRELNDNDEISILDKARFLFKYPRHSQTSEFHDKYEVIERLGKGHFAEVFLCVEKHTGNRFAVKVFTKNSDKDERSKTEGLQQEIAVLMGISHPNLLCLKDTFDEPHAVYLVLELAAEGELFNWIVRKQKLTESETRHVFLQLFQGIKYLHDRNIVHRDIKPENILLTDKNLRIKIADFGLAKIIGEESFTTTLCGTPSYVAPEILADTKNRRYTRAVDIWSMGVVLYICLCGFPPFSDELYTREAPYTLQQQIMMGRFDYPSPYWDPVSDLALDLIDGMLTVDVNKRLTIDDCLNHPWTTQKPVSLTDSTDGLVGGIAGLDFTKRKMARERTLLASINDIKLTKVVATQDDKDPVKVYVKNPGSQNNVNKPGKERDPAGQRDAKDFMGLGGKGDQVLYGDDGNSNYPSKDVGKGKGKKAKT